MRPQSCKAKGRKLQQEVAQDIKDTFTNLIDNDVQSVSMGANGEDIVMSPLAESMFPYSVECKNVEKLNVWKAIEQNEGNAPRGKTPILVISKNRTNPFVVIPWTHFLNILKPPIVQSEDDHTPSVSAADEDDGISSIGIKKGTHNINNKRKHIECDDDLRVELRNHLEKVLEVL